MFDLPPESTIKDVIDIIKKDDLLLQQIIVLLKEITNKLDTLRDPKDV